MEIDLESIKTAERASMYLDGITFEYPVLSRQDTISMLYGLLKTMLSVPENLLTEESRIANRAMAGTMANAIVHMENEAKRQNRSN